MVAQVGRRVDEASPMVDARLPDGSRVNVIIPPLSLSGPLLTIRKFSQKRLMLDDMLRIGTVSPNAATFLTSCIQAELNILISGGTGTGKTTLLNALSASIPDTDRIVTIEDAAELQLHQRHVLRLESRPKNIEGDGEIPIRELVRNSLRMRPDRIIVGEVRGAEALDMLQAMNTGHEGSLTTVHANSPRDALARVETMVLMAGLDLPMQAIRQQLASALDLIIHLERLEDGSRHITHVTEVQRMESDVITLQDIFEYQIDSVVDQKVTGALLSTGPAPDAADEVRAAVDSALDGPVRPRRVVRRASRGESVGDVRGAPVGKPAGVAVSVVASLVDGTAGVLAISAVVAVAAASTLLVYNGHRRRQSVRWRVGQFVDVAGGEHAAIGAPLPAYAVGSLARAGRPERRSGRECSRTRARDRGDRGERHPHRPPDARRVAPARSRRRRC